MQTVFIVLMGFPAVFLSLLVSVIGVRTEKFWLVLIGALLFIPFAYYLSGAPGSYRLPMLLPVLQILSAAALREGNKLWAWILLVPSFLATLWVVGLALFYQFVT